jgi:hypothetical protein
VCTEVTAGTIGLVGTESRISREEADPKNEWQEHTGLDRFAPKICCINDLASHDFDYYLVCYQNLSNSHIWLKSMATFLPNFWFTFDMTNFGCEPFRPINGIG